MDTSSPQNSPYTIQIGTENKYILFVGLNLKVHDFIGTKNIFNLLIFYILKYFFQSSMSQSTFTIIQRSLLILLVFC